MVGRKFKLCVNVPTSHADVVRDAIAKAGGGQAGNYSFCSFSVTGKGRFKPESGANPHIGSVGTIEIVEEEHIEVSPIPQGKARDIINAMLAAHPYEVVGYDLTEILWLEDLDDDNKTTRK